MLTSWPSYYIDHQETITSCPSGYTLSGTTCTLPPNTPDPQKNTDKPDTCAGTNPCNAGTGNKYQPEADYAGIGVYPLKLERAYNSGSTTPSSVETTVWGSRWRGVHDRSISYASNAAISTATVKREGGKQYHFNLSGSSFAGDADVVGTLVRLGVDANGNATGWTYKNENDELENFNAAGKLTAITSKAGLTQALTYSDGTTGPNGGYVLDATGTATATVLPAGRLIRVTDPAARALQYGYDVTGRVVKATDPAGGTYLYSYSDTATLTANLTSVTYPDGKTRTYLYGEAANVSSTPNTGVSYTHSLTGILDENGARYASWTYDAAGRATSSEHGASGSGIDKVTLAYTAPDANGNSTTTVTDGMGTTRTYNFSTLLGVVKNTGIIGQPCDGCNAALTYDPNGNVSSRTDFNGNKACYAHDLTRNLETARVDGLAAGSACPADLAAYTPVANTAERKILSEWDTRFRLPTKVTEAGRKTTTEYDDRGNITRHSIEDTATARTRTWTTRYTYHASVPGVLVQKVDDGPRTDVQDVTTTDYYPHDEVCAGAALGTGRDKGCCGQVKRVANALGQITQFTRYNAHGQAEEIVDPNGNTATFTYDLRQRLATSSIGGQTTTYAYDNVGQLTGVTRPDGGQTTYGYDPAHRLTSIGDTALNTVHFTLDALGNVLGTTWSNPDGSPAQTRSADYDALGRLHHAIATRNGVNNLTAFGYDANGNPTTVTDPKGQTTTTQYDALNRPVRITDALAGLATLAYDARDRLTQFTAPNNAQTSFTVDGLGNVTNETSADRGSLTATYDAAGNLKTLSDARGIVESRSYDALNRPLTVTYPATGENLAYTWDAATGCANGIGRLCQVTDNGGSTTFSYDVRGNVASETRSEGGIALAPARYTWDAADRLVTGITPTGKLLTVQRDPDGRIRQLATAVGGNPQLALVSNIQTDAAGNTTSQSFGNGVTETRTHAEDGRAVNAAVTEPAAGGGIGGTGGDADVPTLPEWGAILLGALLLGIGYRQRRGRIPWPGS